MVGIVVTISPSFNLYRMVVLPAASSPTYPAMRLDELSTATRVLVHTMRIPESFQGGQTGLVSQGLSSMVTRTHFLLAEKARKQAGDRETHGYELARGVRTG